MTESQRQFEEWAKENLRCDMSHNGDHYNRSETYYAWLGWQASRQSVVVRLPDWFVSGIDAAMYRDDVVKALNDAGVDYED